MRPLLVALAALLIVSAAAGGRLADALTISPDKLPDGVVGKPYSVTIKPAGGTNPVLVTCGQFGFDKLPKGVDQKSDPSGTPTAKSITVSGTPQETGSFVMDVCASSDDGQSVRRVYEFKVAGEAPVDEADLVAKAAAPEKVGEYVRFTVTIRNDGPRKATGVVFQGVLERNDTVSATRGRCVDVSRIAFRCTIGELEKGASVQVRAVGKPKDRDDYFFNGSVTSTSRDPIRSNNLAIAVYGLEREADLTLSLSGPRSQLGGSIDWLARVVNRGPDDTWVKVTFDLGGAVDYGKAFPTRDCYPAGETVVCTQRLENGKKTAFTVRGEVALTNRAPTVTVSARADVNAVGQKDPNPSDNRASVTTRVR